MLRRSIKSFVKVMCLVSLSSVIGFSQQVIASIPTDGQVNSFAFNPQNERIYASVAVPNDGPELNQLVIIDGRNQKLLNTVEMGYQLPTRIAVNPATGNVYGTQCFYNLPTCNVQVFDSDGNSITTISVFSGSGGDLFLTNIVVNPITNRVYVGGQPQNGSELVEIDGATNQVAHRIEFGNQIPTGIALDPVRNQLFVLAGQAALDVFDCTTNTIIGRSAEGQFGGVLAVDSRTATIYVGTAENNGNGLDFLEEDDLSKVKTIDLPFAPVAIAMDVASDQAFIAFFNADDVVFEGTSEQRQFHGANGPLAVDPITNILYAVGPTPPSGYPQTIIAVSGVVNATSPQ